MDFELTAELTAEQAALRARARELADGVFAERAARFPWSAWCATRACSPSAAAPSR